MKLLLLLALFVAAVSAATVRMPIYKQMPDGKTLKTRRMEGKPMPTKYVNRLKKGSQRFIDYVSVYNFS